MTWNSFLKVSFQGDLLYLFIQAQPMRSTLAAQQGDTALWWANAESAGGSGFFVWTELNNHIKNDMFWAEESWNKKNKQT